MAGGRPKTPTALKVVRGNPGHRPLNKGEPKPKAASLRAPAGMSRLARKAWRDIAPKLADAQVLTELDTPALVMYCETWAKWKEALAAIDDRGMIIDSPSGYMMQNPYLSIANTAFSQLKSMLTHFGMTPASRAGVSTVEAAAADPMADYLTRGRRGKA